VARQSKISIEKIDALRTLNQGMLEAIEQTQALVGKIGKKLMHRALYADNTPAFAEVISLSSQLLDSSFRLRSMAHDLRTAWVLAEPSVDPEHYTVEEDNDYINAVDDPDDGGDAEDPGDDSDNMPDSLRTLLDS